MKPAHFLAAIILSFGTASSALAACSDPAGARVEWINCNQSRADLYEANLRGADLSVAHAHETVFATDLSSVKKLALLNKAVTAPANSIKNAVTKAVRYPSRIAITSVTPSSVTTEVAANITKNV